MSSDIFKFLSELFWFEHLITRKPFSVKSVYIKQRQKREVFRMKKALAVIAVILTLSACSSAKSDSASASGILSKSEITGEITVSCYDWPQYEDLLSKAAEAFERKFPGTTVILEYDGGLNMKIITGGDTAHVDMHESPDARSSYISKVNTQLMGGRGADIYAIDILPFNSYIETGQLDNFREYMEYDPEFDITSYRQEIFGALTDDKGQFVMPLNYYFDYFMYNETAFIESEAAFTYSMAFGINSNSKNKKTAWEFIKFMLSDEEWRVYYSIPGYHINKNAFYKKAAEQAAEIQGNDTEAALNMYISHIERYTAKAKHLDPYSYDTYITNTALTEGFTPFINGEKTAEEAAKAVQNKLSFYLSE